jgi:hypothetical protein
MDDSPAAVMLTAVGLHPMQDGNMAVSVGWAIDGWAMASVNLPLNAASQLADDITEAINKARNPLVNSPNSTPLNGGIPRNEH